MTNYRRRRRTTDLTTAATSARRLPGVDGREAVERWPSTRPSIGRTRTRATPTFNGSFVTRWRGTDQNIAAGGPPSRVGLRRPHRVNEAREFTLADFTLAARKKSSTVSGDFSPLFIVRSIRMFLDFVNGDSDVTLHVHV